MAFTSVSRPHKIHRVSFLIILTLLIFHPLPAFAQVATTITPESEAALDEELRWLKAETYVITPSRIPEKIKKTASSITVITDRQIRQMGARNLMDLLLRAVPGISASHHNPAAWNIALRGRTNVNSNPILFMINSHPINEPESGGATWVHDTLIVDNIERIEVLRSPGSAVYGANAFLGVVNIITKKADDIDGLELIARGGSWDTQQYNLLYGKTFNEVEVAFNFNYFKTHGYRGVVEEDRQTQWDRFWNSVGVPSNASLAPGRMAGDDEKYDVALNLKYKGLKFDGRYVDKEWEYPIGFVYALNHKSIQSRKVYYVNLSYEASIVEGFDLFGKVYRNGDEGEFDAQLLPPGFIVQTPDLLFVPMRDGFITIGSGKSSRTGIEIQATYKISDSNTVVSGATYEEQKIYDRSVGGNFIPSPPCPPGTIIPLPYIIKFPDWIPEYKRNFKAFFLEDMWDITDDLRLTLGVRYDRYSDFGDEVSPRVGLTWEFIEGYDLKLLYGHAFRAPSYTEIGGWLPGSAIDPETIDTYEISLGAEFTSSLSSRVTFYYRELEDAIVVTGFGLGVPVRWANSPETRRDHGVEIEAEYNFGRGTYLAAHYSYASLYYGSTITVHAGSIMSNIRLSRYLNFFADCRFYDGGERWTPGDTRDDLSGYAVVNATLIAKKFLEGYEGLEFRGSVYNLFDKDYTTFQGPEVANDFPMPGRNFIIELKYKF